VAWEEELERAFYAETDHPPGSGSMQRTELINAYLRGRDAFPEIALEPGVFARHLARTMARMSDGGTVGALGGEDLYLACACLANAPRASETFVARYGPLVRRIVNKVCRKGGAAEVEQDVLAQLLVGSPSSPPELGAYAGRASLGRWLEVVVHRTALRRRRTERAQAGLVRRVGAEPIPRNQTPSDEALFRDKYIDDFHQALRDALHRAPEKDRALLRLHFVENIKVERIGKMMGVSQSSASRWLEKARQSLLLDIKAILAARLGMSDSDVEYLAGAFVSRLDLSISQLLKQSA
jgi:RNA polymerase sigma-70 factor (ECF subfamily)